jgi:hypothetical protein
MTQSMTTVMPIMMGMFSLSFSVGLSIYFIVSNIISIIQYSRQKNFEWKTLIPFGKSAAVETAPKSKLEAGMSTGRLDRPKAKKVKADAISVPQAEIEADEVPELNQPKSDTNGVNSSGPKPKAPRAKKATK